MSWRGSWEEEEVFPSDCEAPSFGPCTEEGEEGPLESRYESQRTEEPVELSEKRDKVRYTLLYFSFLFLQQNKHKIIFLFA